MGTGGFASGLVKESLDVPESYVFLASERYTAKRVGATFAAAVVTADANGDKTIAAGTFVTRITSGAETGKYGPYTAGGANGLGTPDPNVSGYTFEAINLKNGDVLAGILIEGSVLGARVEPDMSDPSAQGAISDACKGRIIFQ